MLLGARQFFTTKSGNAEEEMYKEMFLACVAPVPLGETVTIESDVPTFIGPSFLAHRAWVLNSLNPQSSGGRIISFPNVTQIGLGSLGGVFADAHVVSVNLPKLENAYGGTNFQRFYGDTIELPLLKNFANHEFSYTPTLKTLRLPSVTSKSGSFFVYQDTALENVYLDSMSMATLGVSYVAQQACSTAAVFHCSDGTISYNGSAWVATPTA